MRTRCLFAALAAVSIAAAQSVVPNHVTLPLEEYNRLIEMAAKPPRRAPAPPMPFTIQSAAFHLRVDGENVAGAVQLAGEVLAAGQVKTPLLTGMTVLDAKQNNRALPVFEEGGAHLAVLAGPADFSIEMQVGLPLAIEPGRASFKLNVPAAGAVRMTLTVPGEQTLVNLSPGLITERSSSGGKTTVQATLAPGKPATVWWASRLVPTSPAAPREVRFLSDVKTLLTVGEGDLAMSSVASVTVVQGDPEQFELEIPEGYEVTGATGATLAASDVRGRRLILHVNNAGARAHQFMISMTKPFTGSRAELAPPEFVASQRETGEVLIQGQGTMELTAAERGGLRRMDVKETSAPLRALAHHSLHAAFRYQKKPEGPGVAMEWVRFPDTPVASAVAERAVVTTLVTSEGRSLTEVKLTVNNREQTFLKVALPQGDQILSADVAGEKVKPVTGPDGDRVPLLRAGFRPAGAYPVSFVILHAGAPFAKKGGSELALPKMDVPVELVSWEVFLPKQYRVADFGGDAVPARMLPEILGQESGVVNLPMSGRSSGLLRSDTDLDSLHAGQLGGVVVDPSGASIPYATIRVTYAATGATLLARADDKGRWILPAPQSGRIRIHVDAPGFRYYEIVADYDASRPGHYSTRLEVGAVSESVTVMAESNARESQQVERAARQKQAELDAAPSSNVTALQNRVVGVLPIAVNVPHAGNSYRFVRPLVVDEETRLTFTYRPR